MRKSVSNNQMKAIMMAMAGGTLAAVATMFVPAAMLEGVAGATGLSEMIPAAAAPLGDTARAIIAFGAGAFTLAVLAIMLLRHEATPRTFAPELAQNDEDQETLSFKDRLAAIALPKMPWNKGEDDITELSDLPRLRNGDVHPDAPPRRPLSAQQDLPELNLGKMALSARQAEDDQVVEVEPAPSATEEAIDEVAPVIMQSEPLIAPAEIQPSLAEMVAQLEAAVAERQKQLAELEAVAAQLGAGQVVERAVAPSAEVGQPSTPARPERPPLEAVPASVKDDDMDSALAAALATLHRMNGTDR